VPTRRSVKQSDRSGRLLARGDLLLEKSGGGERQPVGQVVLYDRDVPAVCSNFVARVSLAARMAPRFWMYQHAAAYWLGVNVGSIKQTSGIQNLDQSQYFNERGAFPPLDEQMQIAAFLDRETAKIDALIAEQEKLLALLAEKRQATISHAVTRGLDPNVPMKDSGIAWLGEVPAHWEVKRVKDVSRLESGHTPSKQIAEYWVDCHIPWVSLNDSKQLASNDYISDTAVQINEAGLANSSARLLPCGSVVFTRDATIGLAAITTREMAVSQHLIAWCPTGAVIALYLLRVFNAMKEHLDSLTTGATLKTIGMPEVKRLAMPVPPLSEQAAITHFLEQQIIRFDQLISQAKSAIELLKERRSALIAAAVTGQIDVRNAIRQKEVA
jgi:type I restriction enzyme S subunit